MALILSWSHEYRAQEQRRIRQCLRPADKEQRRRTERQEARQRRLELAIRAYKMPKMMSDMEGNKFLPGDPEYKKWVMLDLTEKAMKKAKQIYGDSKPSWKFMTWLWVWAAR